MKRFFCLLLSLCLICLPQGATAAQAPDPASEVMRLIDAGLEQNREQIRLQATGLSLPQRERIYVRKQQNPFDALIMNFAVGWGVGSFVTHDPAVGLTAALGESAGLLLMLNASRNLPDVLRPSDPQTVNSVYLLIGGGVLFLLSRAFAMGMPFVRAPAYNQQLRETLGIPEQRAQSQSPPIAAVRFVF